MSTHIPYTRILYLEILCFCIVMMVLLTRKTYIFYKYSTKPLRLRGYSRYLFHLIASFFLLSELMSYLSGSMRAYTGPIANFTVTVYYSLCVTTALFFFLFYLSAFFPAKYQNSLVRLLISIPCILAVLLIVSSNFNRLVFSLSDYGTWEHGPLYFIKPFVAVSYYIACCVLSIIAREYARNRFDISRIHTLMVAPLPAIAFSIFQSFARIPIMCVGLVISFTFLTFNIEAQERKHRNSVYNAISADFGGLASFNLDTGEVFHISEEMYQGVEVLSALGLHDHSYYMEQFAAKYISDKDRVDFLNAVSLETISAELSNKRSYFYTFPLSTDIGIKYYQFRFISSSDIKNDRTVIVGLANIDEQTRKQLSKQLEVEEYLRKSSMFQRAATVNALGSFECNLTKDKLIGEVMGRVNGEFKSAPLELFSEASSYTAYHIACANLFCTSEEARQLTIDKFSREALIENFNNGQSIVEHKYWSSFMAEKPTCNRMLFFLSKDEFSDDILGLCITQDITSEVEKDMEYTKQLEHAKKEAEAASLAKSTFLFNMSHDIRTPMNSILGFTRIAQKNLDNREKLIDCLHKVEISETHLLNLINDILDMARIENGKVELHVSPLDIRLSADQISDMVNSDIASKNLRFSLEVNDIVHPFILADSLKLNQVLLNILSNAIKYTKPGGSIRCRFSEAPSERKGYGSYSFCISDTGIGMSKEFLGTIFDSFSREHTTTVSGVQGTGLGMAITKQLVEIMGGSIEVESELDMGTTVSVRIDFKQCDEPSSFNHPAQDDSLQFAGKRILIVEDNELNREIAIDVLEAYPFEIESACNGLEACELFASHVEGYYDLILMDVQMPVMDGYTASKKIREIERFRSSKVAIIAMTANVFDDDLKKATYAGMDGHISKPITPFEFWSEIRRCLR